MIELKCVARVKYFSLVRQVGLDSFREEHQFGASPAESLKL